MEPERRVIFAEPIELDSNGDEVEDEVAESDGDIADDLPVKKPRKFDDEEMRAANQELLLTRHFKLDKEFGPALTTGSLALTKDGRHAIGLRHDKVTIFDVDTAKIVGSIEEENEIAIAYALSPNQQLLAVATKEYTVKVYRIPLEFDSVAAAGWKPELLHTFRFVGTLALELCFDSASRYLAAGTSDSQLKVWDVSKGFQTHNLTGHRGVIVKLAFLP